MLNIMLNNFFFILNDNIPDSNNQNSRTDIATIKYFFGNTFSFMIYTKSNIEIIETIT